MAQYLYSLCLAIVHPRNSVYGLRTAFRDVRHSTASSLNFSGYSFIDHSPLAIGRLHSSLASQAHGIQSWMQIANNSEACFSNFQYSLLQRNSETTGQPNFRLIELLPG